MSDSTNAAETTANVQTSDKPKRTRTRKETFSVSDLARARLKARGLSATAIESKVTDECKVVRGILRSQFGFVAKNDKSVSNAKDYANDRKPWPTSMNKHTFEVVVKGKRPAQKGK